MLGLLLLLLLLWLLTYRVAIVDRGIRDGWTEVLLRPVVMAVLFAAIFALLLTSTSHPRQQAAADHRQDGAKQGAQQAAADEHVSVLRGLGSGFELHQADEQGHGASQHRHHSDVEQRNLNTRTSESVNF